MLRFEPPDLQERLEKALATFRDIIESEDRFWGLQDGLLDADAYDDVIKEDTKVEISFASAEDYFDFTIGDLLGIAESLRRDTLENRTILRMPSKTIVHVKGMDGEEYTIASEIRSGNVAVELKGTCDGDAYEVALVTGATEFAFFVEREGLNEKDYVYSVSEDDLFVVVKHAEATSRQSVDTIVNGFLFELGASGGITLSPTPYPEGSSSHEFPEPDLNFRLRPLILGPGLDELYRLYVAGCVANPAEYALIHFVKIIEFVSATVVRMTRHDALRKRLGTKAALYPDAAFLNDLAELFEEQRIFSKDAEALKLTLQVCCDPLTIVGAAPKVLNECRKLGQDTSAKQRKAAVEQLSAFLTATRNQLSHAKANYELTGYECPADELAKFTACAKGVAEQAIRWYAFLPDHSRVV